MDYYTIVADKSAGTSAFFEVMKLLITGGFSHVLNVWKKWIISQEKSNAYLYLYFPN